VRRVLPIALLAAAAIVGVILHTTRGPASPSPPPPATTTAKAAAPPAVELTSEPAPVRPTRPPGPDDRHTPPREPEPPEVGEAWKRALAARVQGSATPGELAFRAYTDLFVDHNLAFAEKQAIAEGLTVGEVRDLTHFGLLVLTTQRVPEVEELLGRELTAEQRGGLTELMHTTNDGFKREMRALVARGASEAERRQLMQRTDAAYRQAYFALTGMSPELLDDLLAGDLLPPGAPGRLDPPPAGAGADDDGPEDDPADPQRPN
jgi:hypothetical protein